MSFSRAATLAAFLGPLLVPLLSRAQTAPTQSLPPITVTADASDHPLLVARGPRAYLSWLTKLEGYRLIPLGAGS